MVGLSDAGDVRWSDEAAGRGKPLSVTLKRSFGAGVERLALARASYGGVEWLSGYNGIVIRRGASERPAQLLEESVQSMPEAAAPPVAAPAAGEGLRVVQTRFSSVRLCEAGSVEGEKSRPFDERRIVWLVDGAFVTVFDLLTCRTPGEYTVGARWESPIAEADTVRSTQGWTFQGGKSERGAGASSATSTFTLGFPHEGWFAPEGAERSGRSGQLLYEVMARRFREGTRWSVGNALLPHRGAFARTERLPVFDAAGRRAHPRALGMAVRTGGTVYACGAAGGGGLFTFGRGALATDADTFLWWRERGTGTSHFVFSGGEVVRVARPASPPPKSVAIVSPASEAEAGSGHVRALARGSDWTMESDGLALRLPMPAGHVHIQDDLEA